MAVRAVYDCRAALPDAAIVGVGGISRGEDAIELLMAGADAVQVGTATFADPKAPARVLAEVEVQEGGHQVALHPALAAERLAVGVVHRPGGAGAAALDGARTDQRAGVVLVAAQPAAGPLEGVN